MGHNMLCPYDRGLCANSKKSVSGCFFDGHFGVEFFVFVGAHTAQLAERETFSDEKRDTCKGARSEGNQPKHDRRGHCRFLLDSEDGSIRQNGERLGTSANAGKLDGGTDEGEDQNDDGVLEGEWEELST